METASRYTIRSQFVISSETLKGTSPFTGSIASPYYEIGAAVPGILHDKESLNTTTKGTLVSTTCPLCHNAEMYPQEKKLLSFFTLHSLVCPKCNTILKKSGDRYKLSSTTDVSNPLWSTYGKQSLTLREWATIAHGGMSDIEQRKADLAHWMESLRTGAVEMQCIQTATPILPQAGEKVLCAFPQVAMMEPRAVSVSKGMYGGPSIRVTNRISLRAGRYGSTSRSHSEIRKMDTGTLTVTNRRIVFSGSMKTVSADFSKIIEVQPFVDGIALHRSTSQKTQYFNWSKTSPQITITTEGRTYVEPFVGLMLQFLMEGLLRR